MKSNFEDFADYGISLSAPADATATTARANPYSVVLKNNSGRVVVGYEIKWCSESKSEPVNKNNSYDRIISNVCAVVFLHGEEPERREVIDRTAEVIKPQSAWLLSFDLPARQLDVPTPPELDAAVLDDASAAGSNMTVIVEGIFFDDGTFIGPEASNFFTETKTQMDVRYEFLLEVQNKLKSGESRDAVFSELERIHDQTPNLGEQPTIRALREYFRSMFALDVLWKKNLWGIERAIADIQLQLSKPWVKLRKLSKE